MIEYRGQEWVPLSGGLRNILSS